MNTNRIALLVDSGTDVPKEYIERYGIYTIPLIIHYHEGDYRDGVDITAQEVYDRLEEEIPKTSLPNMSVIEDTFRKIVADGYQKVVVVTISSGLSGTYNAVRLVADDFEGLEFCLIDTKNIGFGAGFTGVLAAQLIDAGLDLPAIKEQLEKAVLNTKVFFGVETLEYLHKGGRIGLVSAMLGNTLHLKPVISCNEEGVYYTVSKSFGRKQSIQKAVALVKEYVGESKKFNLAVVNGAAEREAKGVYKALEVSFPNALNIYQGNVSPALVVHTGPGLLGIGVQKLDD